MLRLLTWYGIASLTHFFAQISLSHRNYLNELKIDKVKYFPKIAIIIPSYNEEPENVLACVKSCLNQRYDQEFKIYFVDDGSRDKSAVDALKRLKNKRLVIIEQKENKGKREAQKIAFERIPKDVEIFVTVDSDAILDRKAVFHLVQKFKDKKVGAVTGNVRGKHENFLSRLIDLRYWTAFNQERASQSLFGTVLCCCGVLSAYRSDIIRQVLEDYTNQYFMGVKCTYGDDRNLTNLVLDKGYLVKYEERSKAITSVPLKIKPWLKQQTRWSRSFYRELFFTIKMMWKQPWKLPIYIWYDLAMQTVLPLILSLSLGLMFFRTFFYGAIFFLGYISVLFGVALVRSSYALFRTGDVGFLLFPLYSVMHVFMLIPVRFYAIATLNHSTWGTRTYVKNRQYS